MAASDQNPALRGTTAQGTTGTMALAMDSCHKQKRDRKNEKTAIGSPNAKWAVFVVIFMRSMVDIREGAKRFLMPVYTGSMKSSSMTKKG